MQEQMPGSDNPPTLEEIEILAQRLGVTFTSTEGDEWFDLDRSEPPILQGMYRTTQHGIEVAYGALKRLELTQQAITESNQRKKALHVYQPGMPRRHLAALLGISRHAAHNLIWHMERDLQDGIADPAEK